MLDMKLDEIPTWRLRLILESTKRMAGEDSPSAAVLRRELERREANEALGGAAAADQQQQPKKGLLVL